MNQHIAFALAHPVFDLPRVSLRKNALECFFVCHRDGINSGKQ